MIFFNEKNDKDSDEFWYRKLTLKAKLRHFFDPSPLYSFSKFNNFLWVCWFLNKNLSNFVPPIWKLDNPYYLFSADSSVVVNPWEQFGTIPESLLDSRPGSAVTFWGFVVSFSSSVTSLTFSRLLSLLSILSSLAACSLVSWPSWSPSVLHSSTSWKKKVHYDFRVHLHFFNGLTFSSN